MKKAKIAILTDSSACLPAESMEGLDIHIMPLWLIWDGDKFLDGIDIDINDFYARLSRSKTIPTTSQPSAGEFLSVYKKLAEDYEGIVAVLVSGALSGTIASAEAAKQQFSEFPIEIVDTRSVSMGLGFSVLAAAKAAAEGKSIKEIADAATKVSQNTHFLFAVDTLEFLRKGGRIGGAKALLGTALSIKPILHFEEGVIEPLMQIRTKKKALAGLIEIAKERAGSKTIAGVAVVDIDSEESGNWVANRFKEQFNFTEVLRSVVSPVVGTHAGPGAVGLIFYTE